jgi:tRNA pseudouridine55 synthase
LGCGAHLKALRRTRVGQLSLDDAVTLDRLAETPDDARTQMLAPVDALLSSFPRIALSDALAQRFLHGQRLALGKENVAFPSETGRVRVYREADGQLLGTAQLMEFGVLAPERLVVIDTASSP